MGLGPPIQDPLKSTGGKTYKSTKEKVKVLLSLACRGGGGGGGADIHGHSKDTKQHTHYMHAPNIQYSFHGMVYFPDPG
jgi:hypothetical protein